MREPDGEHRPTGLEAREFLPIELIAWPSRPTSLVSTWTVINDDARGYVPQQAIFPPHTPLGWFV